MKNEAISIESLLNNFGYFAHSGSDETRGVTYFAKGASKMIVVHESTDLKEVIQMLTEQGIQEDEINEALKASS